MFAAEPSGFEVWWSQFINVAYPSIQMLFWIVMMSVAIIAVVTFRRWVASQTGDADDRVKPGAQDDTDARISVEEFVE